MGRRIWIGPWMCLHRPYICPDCGKIVRLIKGRHWCSKR